MRKEPSVVERFFDPDVEYMVNGPPSPDPAGVLPPISQIAMLRFPGCRATDAGQVSGIPRAAVPDGFQHSFLLSVSICPLGLVARETSLKPIIRRRCRRFPHANESDSRVSIGVGLRNTGTQAISCRPHSNTSRRVTGPCGPINVMVGSASTMGSRRRA